MDHLFDQFVRYPISPVLTTLCRHPAERRSAGRIAQTRDRATPSMTDQDLTPAQSELLRGLPERFPLDSIDCVWIFAPHRGKLRESGFLVISLFPPPAAGHGQDRTLVTLRYETDLTPAGKSRREDRIAEEGQAPAERIERVIAGVLARSGPDAVAPRLERIEGRAERWPEVLSRLGLNA
jgi:hypothetical protein